MSRRKPIDTNLLVECVEKETLKRVIWIQKHKDRILKAAEFKGEPKNYSETDICIHKITGILPSITRAHNASKGNRLYHPTKEIVDLPTANDLRLNHTIVSTGLGDPEKDPRLARPNADMNPDPIMRPVPPEQTKLLLKKLPGCTERYLNERSKIFPESKYYFAECSNWDYGWRLKDSKLTHSQRSTVGLINYTQRSIWSHVGPQPDPIYYKSAEIPKLNKCLM